MIPEHTEITYRDNEVLVSIVCVTYNHKKYIKECLEGFLMQKTNFKYEIIVHDDASTDGTGEIIKKIADQNQDIIVPIIQETNQYSRGVDIVNNIIMPKARGRYVAFCEGDDMWLSPEKLQLQVDFMDEHPEYSACVHNTYFRHCEKKMKDFPMFVYSKDTDLTFEDIMKWNAFGYQTSSLLTKKELVEHTPPFGYGEHSMAIYLSLGGKIRFIAKTMSVYRFRSGEFATRANTKSRKKLLDEYKQTVDNLKLIYDYVDSGKKKLVQARLNGYLEGIKYLENMSDEKYLSKSKRLERNNWIKLFVRANFQWLYKILKDKQLAKMMKQK